MYGLGAVSSLRWAATSHHAAPLVLSQPQITTGCVPYKSKKQYFAIWKSIHSGELPADVENLDGTNDEIKQVLELCWQQEPSSRSSMDSLIRLITPKPATPATPPLEESEKLVFESTDNIDLEALLETSVRNIPNTSRREEA